MMVNVHNLSSNWKKLQAQLNVNDSQPTQSKSRDLKRKRQQDETRTDKLTKASKVSRRRLNMTDSPNSESQSSGIPRRKSTNTVSDTTASNHVNAGFSADVEVSKYLAIDCEMVGVGPNPDLESVLARVSIVNYNGIQVYDSYVLPKETVTDWRTHVSGIAPKHMREARSFEEVQNKIAEILKDKIVVGHAVRNDFKVLLLDHPYRDIRDTARHRPYRDLAGGSSPKLKILASQLLGLEIQAGEHSSIEDAKACMLLFRKDKDAFEREHAKKWPTRVIVQRSTTEADNASNANKPKSQTKKKKKRKKK